jgi:ABC-type phosphate transport system substrate-binding protein
MSTKAAAVVALWAAVAFAPFGNLEAQQQKAWLPARSGLPLRGLDKPAEPGKVAVRAKFGCEALNFVEAIAKSFAGSDGLDIAGDDFASLGRFCEFDDPFAVLVQEGSPTPHQEKCWRRRFPAGTPEPGTFPLGELRVVLVVHKSNRVASLSLSQIGKALGEDEKAPTWRDVGGGGGKVNCFGPPDSSWVRRIVQDRCMSGWRDTGTPGVRQMFKLPYRKDLVVCADAKDLLGKVRVDRDGLGLLAFDGQLSAQDFRGVNVVPIVAADGESPVEPSLEPTFQDGYPLSVPVTMYVHPAAPKVATDFAKYCMGQEGAEVVARHGLITPCREEQYRGEQRLADAKSGNGTRLAVVGLNLARAPFQDLVTEYVRSKAVLQPAFSAVDTDVAAIGAFTAGGSRGRDLLLLGNRPSARAMDLHGEKWLELGMDENGKPTGSGPEEHMLAGRSVAVVVNAANPLTALPLSQLRSIFSGELMDSALVGDGDRKPPTGGAGKPRISLYGLPPTDPTGAVFAREALPQNKWKRVTLKASTAGVLSAVSADPQGMGFIDLAALPRSGQTVKVLGLQIGEGNQVKVVEPTPANIRNATYPLSERLYLYVHPQASDIAKDFATFVSTCGASEANPYTDTIKGVMDAYSKHGLFPLADVAIERMAADTKETAAVKEQAPNRNRTSPKPVGR